MNLSIASLSSWNLFSFSCDWLKRKEIYLTERLKTKSSKARVEICSILSEYLKSWFVENPYDFVICDEHGDFISPVNFQERIRDTAKKLDIKFHYHMLRHTYATELMVAGVNPIVVRDLLRHSTVNTTWNVYTHPSRDDQRKVLDDLYDDNVEFMDNDMKIRFWHVLKNISRKNKRSFCNCLLYTSRNSKTQQYKFYLRPHGKLVEVDEDVFKVCYNSYKKIIRDNVKDNQARLISCLLYTSRCV